MYDGFVYLNGEALPYPSRESGAQSLEPQVESITTADGVTRLRRMGKTRSNLELSWSKLDGKTWERILRLLEENDTFTLTYYSMLEDRWKTGVYYAGARTAAPYLVDKQTGRPSFWVDCSVSLLDTGEGA